MKGYVEDMNFLKFIFKSDIFPKTLCLKRIIFEKNLGVVEEHEIAKPWSLVFGLRNIFIEFYYHLDDIKASSILWC